MKDTDVNALKMPPSPAAYASRSEIEDALKSLTPVDQKKLMVAARFWWKRFGLQSSSLGPEDLLQEAVFRALKEERARNWPKHISFVKFLSRGMESIASHHREKMETEKAAVPPPPEVSDMGSQLQAQKDVRLIRDIFADDPKAFDVLALKAQGVDAKEIMDELQLSGTEWETIRKRIRRKLAKYVNANEEE